MEMKSPPTESGGVSVKSIGLAPVLRAGTKGGKQADQVIKSNRS